MVYLILVEDELRDPNKIYYLTKHAGSNKICFISENEDDEFEILNQEGPLSRGAFGFMILGSMLFFGVSVFYYKMLQKSKL